jgi:hypothetical protein
MWRSNSQGYECCCGASQLSITGDTAISGVFFHKLMQTWVTYNNYLGMGGWCTSTVSGGGTGYYGALRNDSVNKKVYFAFDGLSNDTLLYDFNLSVGDTLPVSYINDTIHGSPNIFNWVSAIDSISIGGIYHKQFWISADTAMWQTNYVSIIEGVGSTFGVFAKLIPPFEAGSTLICLVENGLLAYPDGSGVPCDPLTVGINKDPNVNSFEVYPNPVNGKFQIISMGIQQYNIIITDVYGNEIYRNTIVNNTKEIDLSNYSNGIYFVHLRDSNEGQIVKKIIKQ